MGASISYPAPRLTAYVAHAPTPRQHAALLLDHSREMLYGGAAGGGKTDLLLMAALQYVDIPGYSALLLRRTFPQLTRSKDGLIPMSLEWLSGSSAKWNDQKAKWTFPSGATLEFGHLQHEKDKYGYQGPSYQFIGFDELTQFTQSQYRYMLSRLRRLEESRIPLRVRSASNPGGEGHDWVKQRFLIEGRANGRIFVPAKLEDNVFLDRESYEETLAELDPITRKQLLDGDWSARQSGGRFQREWFEIVEAAPNEGSRCRYWDLAATEPKAGKDPDWTSGAFGVWKDGVFFLADMQHRRVTPLEVERLVKQTAEIDGRTTPVWLEQEPGASGKIVVDHYLRNVIPGFACRGDKVTGAKEIRANPLSAHAQAGNVKLVRGPWISAFLDEAESFPRGSHDDQVDAASGAFSKLAVANRWGLDELMGITPS